MGGKPGKRSGPKPGNGNPSQPSDLTARLEELLEVVMSLAALDYSNPASVRGDGHVVDGLAAGLNMLGEELHASTVSREHVDSILRSMADGLLVVDEQGRIEDLNPALTRLIGYPRDELLGASCDLFCARAGEHRCGFADLERGMATGPLEAEFRTREGRTVPVQLTGSPLFGRDGNKRGTVCVAIDITARKEMEAAMAAARDAAIESAELKAAFLANMSHEIRTPLNGVIGMAELLRGRTLPTQEREMVEAISTSAAALLDIVNDVLDFSKIDAGKLDLEISAFELRSVIEDLLQVHALSAQQKRLELLAIVDADVPRAIRGDAARIRQVLNNLVSNAVKFTEDGEIGVDVRVLERANGTCRLRFAVRDTGVGVPAAARASVFDAFAQADSSTTRRFQGTGLGLAISSRLVDAMGGEIGLVSAADNRGSEFWFVLPVDIVETGQPPELPDLARARVLVVDDNATNRRILHSQIQGWNGRCESAASGAEALELVRRADADDEPIRALVLDLNMPEMDGLMLARAIREDQDLLDQPGIVVLTSYLSPISVAVQAELAIAKCLTKPARPELLARAVMRATKRESGTITLVPTDWEEPDMRSELSVLVVDDNPINQKVALGQLAKLGLRGHAVGNGREALDAVRRFTFSLILLDVYMPEMDGYEATKLLRDNPKNGRVPIVAMTASATSTERAECLEAGMDDFLAKPITESALRGVLERWLPGWTSSAVPPPIDHPPAGDIVDSSEEAPVDFAILNRLRELEVAAKKSGFLADLIDLFLRRTPETIATLRQAISSGDSKGAVQAAHSLKGSTRNVGALGMGRLAEAIEGASGERRLEAAALDLERLEREFARVAEAFQQERDGEGEGS